VKIRYTKNGKIADVKNGYALRLIEQGKAVAAGETAEKKAAKRTAKPAADKTDGAEGSN